MPANNCHLKVHVGMEHTCTCTKGWEGVGYYHPHKMFGPHLPSPSKIPPVPFTCKAGNNHTLSLFSLVKFYCMNSKIIYHIYANRTQAKKINFHAISGKGWHSLH